MSAGGIIDDKGRGGGGCGQAYCDVVGWLHSDTLVLSQTLAKVGLIEI